MKNYYKVKAKYKKYVSGKLKEVSGYYVLQAENCTEAEEEASIYLSNYYVEYKVVGITKAKYYDIFFDSIESISSLWYDAKLELISYNEATGIEKKMKVPVLTQGLSVKDVFDRIEKEMKYSTLDYRIISIGESSIFEVIRKKD